MDNVSAAKHIRVLAVASGGGHWAQLLRMRPAWEGCHIAYVTTHKGYCKDIDRSSSGGPEPRFYVVPDANRSHKLRLLSQVLAVAIVVLRERPHVVITTGASVGFFGVFVAKKLLRSRTIWVDSIANAAELSLSGQRAEKCSDVWLTQWPDLAKPRNSRDRKPSFWGSVL